MSTVSPRTPVISTLVTNRVVVDRTRPAPVVPVWATRATAAQVMLGLGTDAVLVLDDDRVLGIVTASDLAASLVESAASASAAEQQHPIAEDRQEIRT